MELDTSKTPVGAADRGEGGIVAVGDRAQSLGEFLHTVAVTHPYQMLAAGQPLEQAVRFVDSEHRGAVLAPRGSSVARAQVLRDHEHAVANSQHRAAQVEHLRTDIGRVGPIQAGGAARQNNAFGVERANLLEREIIGMDLAVDPRLANAARDELSVLTAKVKN